MIATLIWILGRVVFGLLALLVGFFCFFMMTRIGDPAGQYGKQWEKAVVGFGTWLLISLLMFVFLNLFDAATGLRVTRFVVDLIQAHPW